MANITIHDIAKRAKVSSAAVSYVINNQPGVSEKKREEIKRIIEETGYTPNLSSRKLVLNKSFNIHIAMGSQFVSFDNLFYNAAIHRMIEVCTENGYNLVLSGTKNYETSSLNRAVLQKDVDGVVFLQETVPSAVRDLQKMKIPYVILDDHDPGTNHNSVYCDYEETAAYATRYLIEKGHRRIAFVGLKTIDRFYQATLSGYRKALSEAGVVFSEEWVYSVSETQESLSECVTTIGIDKKEISAVLCATDMIAVMLMKECEKRRIVVPRDVSVCGIDDILLARYTTPTLTTVKIDQQKMGEESIRLLLKLIQEKETSQKQKICIPSKIIAERESVINNRTE